MNDEVDSLRYTYNKPQTKALKMSRRDFQQLYHIPSMALLPAGEFLMGSPPSEPEMNENEGPQHQVRIEKPFAIGKYEVTFEEYDAFAQATQRDKPNDEGWGRGQRPVINVSWEDATAYAKWLSEQTRKPYRLPSEAEWEYAARAGTTTPFHTGQEINTEQANFNGNYTYNGSAKGEYRKKTVEVGSFPANAFGLHDMHGNVWEWVQDFWNDNYEGAHDGGSALESGDCTRRVLRGGSWFNRSWRLRSAYRNRSRQSYRSDDVGFRLAMDLKEKKVLNDMPNVRGSIEIDYLDAVRQVTKRYTNKDW